MKTTRAVVSGNILVTKAEADRWRDDSWLRSEVAVLARSLKNDLGSLVPVTTEGGFVVDVWDTDHWQTSH